MKITHPLTRAALGVTALVVIALLANWLVLLTPQASRGIDFTEKNIHTLSGGTKAILEQLDAPVIIRYYATRSSDFMPEDMKLHMRRVDDLLKEYSTLGGGNLRIEHLDPEPDTEAEDAANLDGITGTRINDQNLYFGLAVSCLDQTRVIPFLDPMQETMLEYELSSRIAEVSIADKPKIGVMAGVNLQGGAGNPMMGQRMSPPWVIYQQMQQNFELVDIPMEQPEIDPEEIKVLFLFHPAGISPATEFAIDQYLLKGGTVVACLDSYSVAAQMAGGGNPMMGTGAATTSTLPRLLKAWGVEFESGMTLADPVHATEFSDNRTGLAVLSLPQEAMPQKDSVITRDLESIILFLPGGFTRTEDCKVGYESLVRSSMRAGYVDSMTASRLETKARDIRPLGKRVDLMARIHGKFPTAFPDGNPVPETPTEEGQEAPLAESLKQATAEGNVFLIADIDAFYNDFAYRIQNIGGMNMASASNGNSSLLLNLLDLSVGSKHLIGSRSRAAVRRPFTVIREMEENFNEEVGARIEELREKEREATRRLNELQVQKTRGNQLFLSPEQEAEIIRMRKEQVEYARQIREMQKDLRSRKDKLTGNITLLNVAIMPAFVILIGLGLYFQRRVSTGAR